MQSATSNSFILPALPVLQLVLLLLRLLLSVEVVVVNAFSPLDTSGMTAKIMVKSGIEFYPQGHQYKVSSATANLSWFPRQSMNQNIIDGIHVYQNPMNSNEPFVNENDTIELYWENLDPQVHVHSVHFELEATVETTNYIIPIYECIPFPLQHYHYDEMMRTYLNPGTIADQSIGIQRTAQSLVVSQSQYQDTKINNDLYTAVFRIADYVSTNIEYSLASEGQPTIQSASQVLQSGYGKCDEITGLFISLCRAVGIPSRFASGYAYTDSQLFQENWGTHCWAEVWFPVGTVRGSASGGCWIPYDVTYGQFGYVDASHVKLSMCDDANPSNVQFNALGTDFVSSDCKFETQIVPLNFIPTDRWNRQLINISFEAQPQEVGFGSSAVFIATITNNRDYYIASQLYVSEDLVVMNTNDNGNNLKQQRSTISVCLSPNQVLELPFFINFEKENYQSGYVYQQTYSIRSNFDSENIEATITIKEGSPIL